LAFHRRQLGTLQFQAFLRRIAADGALGVEPGKRFLKHDLALKRIPTTFALVLFT
jgi:hypothetical protein